VIAWVFLVSQTSLRNVKNILFSLQVTVTDIAYQSANGCFLMAVVLALISVLCVTGLKQVLWDFSFPYYRL